MVVVVDGVKEIAPSIFGPFMAIAGGSETEAPSSISLCEQRYLMLLIEHRKIQISNICTKGSIATLKVGLLIKCEVLGGVHLP